MNLMGEHMNLRTTYDILSKFISKKYKRTIQDDSILIGSKYTKKQLYLFSPLISRDELSTLINTSCPKNATSFG